ncbi:MAG: hypothetical protein KC423_05205 [Anaerolineales bacterium]|nr:hypothetical protein [Anaerolineales bacterium]
MTNQRERCLCRLTTLSLRTADSSPNYGAMLLQNAKKRPFQALAQNGRS